MMNFFLIYVLREELPHTEIHIMALSVEEVGFRIYFFLCSFDYAFTQGYEELLR